MLQAHAEGTNGSFLQKISFKILKKFLKTPSDGRIGRNI
jgi:hypothetical protein